MLEIVWPFAPTVDVFCVIIYTVVFAVALFLYFIWNFNVFNNMGVPGPKPIPIFGTWHLYYANGIPYDLILKTKYGRTFGIFDGVNPVLVTSDLDLIKQVGIKEFENFHNHKNIFTNKNFKTFAAFTKEQWLAIRPPVITAFTGAKLKKTTCLIDDSAKDFAINIEVYAKTGETFDVLNYCKRFTMDVIAKTLFATQLQNDQNNPFIYHAKKMVAGNSNLGYKYLIYAICPHVIPILARLGFADKFPTDSVNFFKALVDRVILQRSLSKDKPKDILQILLDTRDGKIDQNEIEHDHRSQLIKDADQYNEKLAKSKGSVLTDEDVNDVLVMLLLAGYEAVANTLGYVMYSLAMHGDVQEKLYKEIKQTATKSKAITYENVINSQYLDQVVNEVMRMYPIAQRTDRLCYKTCNIGPYTIPKGMQIQFATRNVHYDEEYWPEPHKFDPERFAPENRHKIVPNSLMPFGIGPRVCLGLRLAMLEIKLAVMRVVNEYQILRCEKTEDPPILQRHHLPLPVNGFWVSVKRRVVA